MLDHGSKSTQNLISMLRSISRKPAVADETACDTVAAQLEELIANNVTFDEPILERVERFLKNASFKPDVSVTFVRRLFRAETRPKVDPERVKRIIVRLLRDVKAMAPCNPDRPVVALTLTRCQSLCFVLISQTHAQTHLILLTSTLRRVDVIRTCMLVLFITT
jgi:hypothetical protein